MPPIPEDRMLTHEAPFAATGIDYFGPLLVKRGRGVGKRYGRIFTCLTIRAAHIEVVCYLKTDSFVCAFSRFTARRGYPIRIYSDNGTDFRDAEAELRQSLRRMNREGVQSSSTTGIYLDLGALTPNHLLLIQGNLSVESSPGSNMKLTRRWRQAQQLADTFWVRWIKEYLPTLHQRQKWVGSDRDLKVGDLVLLVDASASKGSWPKGVVQTVTPGKDGRFRDVTVQTVTGFLKRDVRHLRLLE
ncbi:hypothetical protein X801_08361 [Opisthorchis viverrini]|uniref:DUF5641 domain-containing protein n=1 Tax=Opisthorchis viverrini TaxID=6198 RepID=A0A1S8WMX8_OPIVI|nr:hypothetical protein X801_08361 [Opisthorchis viverrini]